MSCAKKAQPIKMSFGMDSGRVKKGRMKKQCSFIGGGPAPLRGVAVLRASPANCRYREYQACGQYLNLFSWVAAVMRSFAVTTAATCLFEHHSDRNPNVHAIVEARKYCRYHFSLITLSLLNASNISFCYLFTKF